MEREGKEGEEGNEGEGKAPNNFSHPSFGFLEICLKAMISDNMNCIVVYFLALSV